MLQTVTELKRYPVFNRRGDKLGVIDDVVFDADGWKLCYAVLRRGRAGSDDKLLGVALHALAFDSENECLITAADPETLEWAPGMDRESPPQAPDPRFRNPENG
jgi:sporulation protein YlmC with PRC-barrel domain